MKYIKYSFGKCAKCGKLGETIGHHVQYRKPRTDEGKRKQGDVVIRVCKSCHKYIHKCADRRKSIS